MGFGPLAFSPDGTILAAVSDRVIQLWEVKTGVYLGDLRGSIGSIHVLAFSPDGKTLVSADCLMCGPNTDALAWDVPSRSLKADLQTTGSVSGSVEEAAFTANGSLITVGMGCCHVQTSDLQARQWHNLQLEDIGGIASLKLSDDGNYLLIANGDTSTFTIWDLKQRSVLGEVSMAVIYPEVHNFGFGNSAFSPDGNYIATVNDGTLVVWKFQ